ncbi:MAG TPA: glycosyltransferase, partial [Micropepsaceae bacterium]|nr:glycosyltransferase [Micropepsaceae bacterium]
YDEPLAHRLVAGADMLLHPARFEPCGLVPIYAMRYGTIPIVRKSGGMADTILDATPENLKTGTATGFCFDTVCADELIACAHRAMGLYGQSLPWRKLQVNAMRQDFSWSKSAKLYAALYRSLTTKDEPMESDTTASERISA